MVRNRLLVREVGKSVLLVEGAESGAEGLDLLSEFLRLLDEEPVGLDRGGLGGKG